MKMLAKFSKIGLLQNISTLGTLCLMVLMIMVASDMSAQEATKRTVKIKAKDVKNISTVTLESNGRKFPAYKLYRTTRSELTLLRDEPSDMLKEGHFAPFKVELDAFDKVVIHNRKRTIWASIIGGVGLAGVSYFVVDQLSENNLDSPQLELLGQETSHRFIEPIVAGILGAGIGVIVGEMLAPIRIDLTKDKKEGYRKLRQYSYR